MDASLRLGRDGIAGGVRHQPSPNCDERPPGEAISLLVVHSISLPPGEYGGDAIERLFTNRLDHGDRKSVVRERVLVAV